MKVERLGREREAHGREGHDEAGTYRFTNVSGEAIDTHLLIVVGGLPAGTRVRGASGTTHAGEPYFRVFLPDGELKPGQQLTRRVELSGRGGRDAPPRFTLLSGQGNP